MKDCINFKRGDFAKLTVNKKTVEISSDVNIDEYVEYIGIVNKLGNDMLTFCVTMETQTGLVHFANENNKEHINFELDKIIDANLAIDANFLPIKDEIEYFYRGIFKYYTVEEDPNWFEYFTDSTYYEIKDWFAYMCGIESDYELLDNDFVYDYAQYIWAYLMKNFTEKSKDEDKMISLNVDERGIPIKEYMNLINQKIISEVDYGKWINFKESYPPLKDKPYDGVLIEILHQGNPFFHSIFHNGERVFLRCYDWHNDLLEYRDPCYTSDYWRFVPAPPGNESYDVG